MAKILLPYPIIDRIATGRHIRELRIAHGYTNEELAEYLCLTSTRALYYWQNGQLLPSVDCLLALSVLFEMSINDILVVKAE